MTSRFGGGGLGVVTGLTNTMNMMFVSGSHSSVRSDTNTHVLAPDTSVALLINLDKHEFSAADSVMSSASCVCIHRHTSLTC